MYTLRWKKSAKRELAEVWLASGDRNAVTAACHTAEVWLKRNPLEIGESRRSSVHRVLINPPLAIEYEVVEDDKKVIVLAVQRWC